MQDEYKIAVIFTRYHHMDDEVIQSQGFDVNLQTVREQLTRELQEAYDNGGIAGFFEVI